MDITFYNRARDKSFTISQALPDENHSVYVWLNDQDGAGCNFIAEDITCVIFEALEKYFNENF